MREGFELLDGCLAHTPQAGDRSRRPAPDRNFGLRQPSVAAFGRTASRACVDVAHLPGDPLHVPHIAVPGIPAFEGRRTGLRDGQGGVLAGKFGRGVSCCRYEHQAEAARCRRWQYRGRLEKSRPTGTCAVRRMPSAPSALSAPRASFAMPLRQETTALRASRPCRPGKAQRLRVLLRFRFPGRRGT